MRAVICWLPSGMVSGNGGCICSKNSQLTFVVFAFVGIKLRKVEEEKAQQSKKLEPGKSSLHNVAEVMLQARRKAMQSDTEDDSSPDSGSEWGEGHP